MLLRGSATQTPRQGHSACQHSFGAEGRALKGVNAFFNGLLGGSGGTADRPRTDRGLGEKRSCA
jgi:hypothetical protein